MVRARAWLITWATHADRYNRPMKSDMKPYRHAEIESAGAFEFVPDEQGNSSGSLSVKQDLGRADHNGFGDVGVGQ